MLHVALPYIQLVYLFRATSHFVQGFVVRSMGQGTDIMNLGGRCYVVDMLFLVSFCLAPDRLRFVFLSCRSGCRMYLVLGCIMSSTQCVGASGDPHSTLVRGCICPPSAQRHNGGIRRRSDSIG